jgi:hypothetical protein
LDSRACARARNHAAAPRARAPPRRLLLPLIHACPRAVCVYVPPPWRARRATAAPRRPQKAPPRHRGCVTAAPRRRLCWTRCARPARRRRRRP